MQRERMISQVHCIPSGDHILMTASTSKHISQIRLYKAWKGNNRFCCGGRASFNYTYKSLRIVVFPRNHSDKPACR
ncbi:hypothetical protein ISN45_Aa06g004220 [Arabidopsis thaliana x Arabidopsis arenosa]|uniref:Uncharacterized protein n=2 Tax=Arabidopsis TaxID=3701 RepID=A0A8T1Z8A4_ARASU|nr:hypothetical protein ISN45_Aa06g004220 [Arabidopsis thaliana x Arabidopsis arenosa]KAG7554154.1 hypothetical protein ISN44_As11g004280 [Arabidopsis suecica]